MNTPTPLAVTLTVAELRALVREEVSAALQHRSGRDDDLLTRDQVADLLQVHAAVVSKYVRADGLPARRIGPRELRFSRAAVLAWLEERAVQPGAHTEHHGRKLRAAKGG